MARSKLADVLADIKNSRTGEDNVAPTPPKRRSTVNYVALSGHRPRQTRPKNTPVEIQVGKTRSPTPATNHQTSTPHTVRIFDRVIMIDDMMKSTSLYALGRAWVHGNQGSRLADSHSSQEQAEENDTLANSIKQIFEVKSTQRITTHTNAERRSHLHQVIDDIMTKEPRSSTKLFLE